MNLNATFVHNYPLVHTYFIAIFLLFLISPSLKADWEHPGIRVAQGEALRISLFPPEREAGSARSQICQGWVGEDKNSLRQLTAM